MNLPKFSLNNTKLVYFFLFMMVVGGIFSFGKLGKKEDAPFVIKTVVLVTQYPGATPEEVSKLISEPIEREVQTMGGLKNIKSENYFGLSKITVELHPKTAANVIPQKWDELRRKVLNIQSALPQGASNIMVSDDFGDVFGMYYGLIADEGFSWAEMRQWAERLKTELVTVTGVQKVALFGVQTEVVNLFISMPTLANLGIDPNSIVQIVSSQNQLFNTGVKQAGSMNLTILATGTYANLDDIRNQIISTSDGQQIRLGDIATIERGYMDPPTSIMRINGKPAIGIGISSLTEVDVVQTGELVNARLAEMAPLPIGMELVPLYLENKIASEANNGFIINLVESLLIVIFIIMFVMGARAGVLIGSSLIFSIGGTMLLMLILGVGLNRTSLAGFIIAMGMLVDNAIVVTDNAQVAMKRGVARRKALIDGAVTPQWGLLGATFIGVCSFLPLYLAPSAVAEIVKPLFIVLALSLGLSWFLALTQTPVFGNFILKEPKIGAELNDPYDTRFYRWFTNILTRLIRWRGAVLGIVGVLFVVSLWVMGIAPQSFFPNLEKPYFKADVFLPDGYSIAQSDEKLLELSNYLMEQEGVVRVSATAGSSPLRYYLASTSFGPRPNFGNILIETESPEVTNELERKFYIYAKTQYPDLIVRTALFKLSPAVEATIEIGFIGNNADTLVMLVEKAKSIMRDKCDLVGDVRSDWGNKVPVLTPVYSQEKGQRLGITRQAVAQYTRLSTTGLPMGEYREGDLFMPILLKDATIDNFNLVNFGTLPIFNPQGMVVSLDQVTDSISESYMYNMVRRYQRQNAISAQCDPLLDANTALAFKQVYAAVVPELEKILPDGYTIKVFGEQESQDESNEALAANMPLTFFLIFATLLLLFRTYRRPTVILLMIPLIAIGVVLGLALSGNTLDFFAILGVLGLIGMNIKNAVVLVDQIDIEIKSGLTQLDAVIVATRSRIVPVVMASGTTILGMLPLLPDALFGGMASVIMGGLLVATFLTIVVLPVTYCLIMRIKSEK